jgi:hypothetical protein
MHDDEGAQTAVPAVAANTNEASVDDRWVSDEDTSSTASDDSDDDLED